MATKRIQDLENVEEVLADSIIPVGEATKTKSMLVSQLKNWLSGFFVGKTGNEIISGIKFFESVIKSYQNNRVIERINKGTGKTVATLETQSSDPTNNGLGLFAFSEDGSTNGSIWLRYNNGSPHFVMGNNFSLATSDRTQKIPTTQWVKTVMEQSGGMAEFNKNQNGYIKFLNGITIQWGYATFNGSGTTITFPKAFSNKITSLICQIGTDVNNAFSVGIVPTAYSNTNFTAHGWQSSGPVNKSGWWVAIGY